jgi:hypothetical protein
MIETVTPAADVHPDLIVQLGDFGLWPRVESGRRFLRKVEARLELLGLSRPQCAETPVVGAAATPTGRAR